MIKMRLLDTKAEYFSSKWTFQYALFFKKILINTINDKVKNIHKPSASTRGIIQLDFHNAIRSKNILQAKLHGANQAKNATHKLVVSFVVDEHWCFLSALNNK